VRGAGVVSPRVDLTVAADAEIIDSWLDKVSDLVSAHPNRGAAIVTSLSRANIKCLHQEG